MLVGSTKHQWIKDVSYFKCLSSGIFRYGINDKDYTDIVSTKSFTEVMDILKVSGFIDLDLLEITDNTKSIEMNSFSGMNHSEVTHTKDIDTRGGWMGNTNNSPVDNSYMNGL